MALCEKAISILMDKSFSLRGHWKTQINAISDVLKDDEIIGLIERNRGGVALNAMYFNQSHSGAKPQVVTMIDMQVIRNRNDAIAFAEKLKTWSNSYGSGSTPTAAAISASTAKLKQLPAQCHRYAKRVINLITDGEADDLQLTTAASDAAEADYRAPVQINVLAMGNVRENIIENDILTENPKGFMVYTPNIDGFKEAFKKKFKEELVAGLERKKASLDSELRLPVSDRAPDGSAPLFVPGLAKESTQSLT